MKFYLRLSLNIFKQNMAYRFEYITKVVALFLTVFAQYYIWRVLLVYQNNTSDVNITEMTTYHRQHSDRNCFKQPDYQ